MFVSSVSCATPFRIPMIKFVGARLPRPNFARVVSGPIPSSPAPAATSAPSSSSVSVGKAGRTPAITEDQLPPRYRRPPISQEECDAINAGGAYGL